MATTNYQKFLCILAKWPVNPQKKTRDYAFHLRTLLKREKPDQDFFPGKSIDTLKRLNSLVRLGENLYRNKYPPSQKKGGSGMEPKDVSIVLTDEFIEYFNSNQGFLKHFYK